MQMHTQPLSFTLSEARIMHPIYHSSHVSWSVIARAIFMSIVLLVATAGIVRGQTPAFEVKDGVTSLLKVETDGDVIVSGTITPDVDSAKNLGASLFRWDVVFTDFGDISNDLEIGGDIFAKINNASDLGTTSIRWKKIWSEDIDASGDLIVGDNLDVGGIFEAKSSSIFRGEVKAAPDATHDLGTSTFRWKTVFAANGVSTTSDRRLKEDISELTYGLREVLLLRPVSFRPKSQLGEDIKLGLLAQDVQAIIKEVVSIGDEPDRRLGIYYSDLIPVLIKAIQEQQAIIDQQQAQFDTLAATLEHLTQTRSRPINSMAGLLGGGLCLLLVLVSVGRNKRRPIAPVE